MFVCLIVFAVVLLIFYFYFYFCSNSSSNMIIRINFCSTNSAFVGIENDPVGFSNPS